MKRPSTLVLFFCLLYPLLCLFSWITGHWWSVAGYPREYSSVSVFGALPLSYVAAYFLAKRFGHSLAEESVETIVRTVKDIHVTKPFLLKGVYAKVNKYGVQADHFVSWQQITGCRIIKGKNDFGRDISRLELLGAKNKKLLTISFQLTEEKDAEEFIGVIKAALTNSTPQS